MRVAIFAYGRTGSTSLCEYIRLSLQLESIVEPFNRDRIHTYTSYDLWKKDNKVVKFMYPDIKYIDKIQSNFDKIIYLTRENHIEAAESHVYAELNDCWTGKYSFADPPVNFVNKMVQKKKEQKTHINSLGGFQVTYEEIFYTKEGVKKVDDYLGIISDHYKEILDIKHKYRKQIDFKKII